MTFLLYIVAFLGEYFEKKLLHWLFLEFFLQGEVL